MSDVKRERMKLIERGVVLLTKHYSEGLKKDEIPRALFDTGSLLMFVSTMGMTDDQKANVAHNFYHRVMDTLSPNSEAGKMWLMSKTLASTVSGSPQSPQSPQSMH